MNSGTQPIDKVKRIMKEKDLRQSQIALRLGVGQSAISKWMRGDNGPDRDTTAKIDRLYTETFPDEVAQEAIPGVKPESLIAHINVDSGTALRLQEDGSVRVEDGARDGVWSFPEVIRRRLRSVSTMYAFEFNGDEMLPTIHPSATIFVDTAIRAATNGAYAISTPRGIVVRRLKFDLDGTHVEISADNKAEYPETQKVQIEDLNIIGRVIGNLYLAS